MIKEYVFQEKRYVVLFNEEKTTYALFIASPNDVCATHFEHKIELDTIFSMKDWVEENIHNFLDNPSYDIILTHIKNTFLPNAS